MAHLSVDGSYVQSQTTIVVVPRGAEAATARATGLVAHSAAMREIARLVPRVAATDAPVLIEGEAGVGKAAVAREIHALSRRAGGPLVRFACGAFRECELETQLVRLCTGEAARESGEPPSTTRRGTLLLDDVSRLPFWAQARLFDAIQQPRQSGSSNVWGSSSRFRVIASATCDLETAMSEGRFHRGLYYYLDAVHIHIPPLRHRQEDIRALADRFLVEAGALRRPPGGTPWRFSIEAWQCMLRHPWPGNAWELASAIAQAVVLADADEIGPTCILRGSEPSRKDQDCETLIVPLTGSLKQMERAIIEEVVQRCKGNKAAAARTLGLHRRTLYRLLEAARNPLGQGDRDESYLFDAVVS